MRVAGVDGAGEVRIVELDDHPFYIATLFQPELAVFTGVAHPLIKAFLREAAKGPDERTSSRRSLNTPVRLSQPNL